MVVYVLKALLQDHPAPGLDPTVLRLRQAVRETQPKQRTPPFLIMTTTLALAWIAVAVPVLIVLFFDKRISGLGKRDRLLHHVRDDRLVFLGSFNNSLRQETAGSNLETTREHKHNPSGITVNKIS